MARVKYIQSYCDSFDNRFDALTDFVRGNDWGSSYVRDAAREIFTSICRAYDIVADTYVCDLMLHAVFVIVSPFYDKSNDMYCLKGGYNSFENFMLDFII